jgi:hypothetical protein
MGSPTVDIGVRTRPEERPQQEEISVGHSHQVSPARRTYIGLSTVSALALACALIGGVQPAKAEMACATLKGAAIPKEAVALPISGVNITSADVIPAAGAMPSYCKVLGEMAPIDPKAHAILFQVNLPEEWNGKAVQYGGGGMNGTLVTAVGPLRDQAPVTPVPIAQGYATMGTDSGHPDLKPDIGVFMLNDEEFTNYAYAAYKKTYDAATAVMAMRYGKRPARVYYFGGSEGGREAMSAVQRFPKDYDGVVATVPGQHWIGLFMANQRYFDLATRGGGFLSNAKLKLVQRQALDKCDKLDGVEDGIISRYVGCHALLESKALRCPDGKEGDACLSDAQVALVASMRTPIKYGFALANGYTEAKPMSVGAEGNTFSVNPWIMGETPVAPDDLGRERLGPGVVRFAIARDPNFRGQLDMAKYRARIQEVSKLLDMTNPDISAFAARGGKLIMKENTGDYIVSPYGVFEYYDNMTRKVGPAKAQQFTRLYVSPGVSHIGSAPTVDNSPVADKVDLLGALDAWVDKGAAPGTLTATSYTTGTNPQVVATRPMCPYPTYPHFTGTGDWKKAENFTCRSLK